MKIVVLTGCPCKNSNSAYLAKQFIKEAEEQGHEVYRFDCTFKQVEPCRACNLWAMSYCISKSRPERTPPCQDTPSKRF